MASIHQFVSRPPRREPEGLEDYLQAAAKIVETVAFEMASKGSASSVQELLALACGIEQAATRLRGDI